MRVTASPRFSYNSSVLILIGAKLDSLSQALELQIPVANAENDLCGERMNSVIAIMRMKYGG
jgi:hypothetical protein